METPLIMYDGEDVGMNTTEQLTNKEYDQNCMKNVSQRERAPFTINK